MKDYNHPCIGIHTNMSAFTKTNMSTFTNIVKALILVCMPAIIRAFPGHFMFSSSSNPPLSLSSTVAAFRPILTRAMPLTMAKEYPKNIGAARDVDDKDWEQWTARFAGKFVINTGTATLTSRRAALDPEVKGICNEHSLAILQLDAGRKLSGSELQTLANDAKEFQFEFDLANLRDIYGECERHDDNLDESKIESKTVNYVLGNGRVLIKAVVPRDPFSVLDQLYVEPEAQPHAVSSVMSATPPQEYIPYWVQLWPSALVLSDEFASARLPIINKRVVEVSAGLGLPGVTAGVMGAERVLLTEFDPVSLPHIHRNARANAIEVETSLFDWFRPTSSELMMDVDEWDVICLADVMYEDSFIKAVAKSISRLLAQNRGSTVVFVDPLRRNLPLFEKELHTLGLQVSKSLRTLRLYQAQVDSGGLKTEVHSICILTINRQDSA